MEKIAIVCECVPAHDWMAFASWYSISKRLPDCVVELECRLTVPIFGWARRVGVRIVRESDALFRIGPTVMALRDFDGDPAVSSSRGENQTTFVDYSEGCGDFVADKWINRTEVPFMGAMRRFGSKNKLTVNEVAILDFWEKCHQVYRSIGGI